MIGNAYDKPINKEIPWDGNETTGNLPVRGNRIEEFLKKELDSKMGILYYDVQNNRNLVFADVINRDKYLENPEENKNLVLGSFDAPFNYTAEINLLSPSYNVIDSGTKGIYLEFTFDVKNISGASTGEDVNVTYTFKRNSAQSVIKETRRFGEKVRLNIDDYLLAGTNIVTINIVGQTSLAATTIAVTYQILSLSLTDEMDIAKVYNLTTGEDTVAIPYTLTGQGTKMMEWYVNGEQVTPNVSEDEINDTTVSKIKYIPLKDLSSGVHNIQIRAYALINGERFYTNTLYREIMVNNGDINEILVATKTIVPKEYGIIPADGTFTLYGVEQYLPYTIEFATSKSTDVAIKFGETESELTLLSTIKTVQGAVSDYSITPSSQGNHLIVLSTVDTSRTINVSIAATTLDIKEITDALEFSFTARGRSNSATDKDTWNGFGYTATFEGFKWNNQSGWVDNALLIGEGASVSFDYAPLSTNSVSTGKTIELEFSTRNVDNDDAVICDLRNSDGTGLLLTASEARLISRVGNVVYTKFKSDDRNRIAFVINRNANVVNKNLVFIYVNGILSGAINYGSADNYLSETLLSLRGTSDAQIALYSVLVYNTALSNSQILNNYTLYRSSIEDMRSVYDKNDVLEEGSISVSKTRHRLPIMIITGNLLELDEKSDTDYYITADIDYYNDQDPTKNFKIEGARIRIQGTSSRFYPRKNYRFYTNKADFTVLYDANGNVVKDGLYAFKDNAQPVDCWCLKADFAESSGTHNTGVARIWNEVMVNANFSHTNNAGIEVSGYPLRTQAQISAKKEGFTKDVRTTIDGFPILLFRRDSENDEAIFVGKYNFNNDKSTPNVFGFTGIPGFNDSKVQSWECLENEDPIALFKTVDGFFDDTVDADGKTTKRWELAFEARHEGSSASVNDLYTFCSWVASKNGKSEEFATEKWEHMDVYKVAAYYVYLIRFGALDQVVKNCFLTSEDGIHFYFINYDNDTILGVDNTGEISALPDVDRQSQYENGSYVYAGHESVLWNMLEADSEFMSIVRIVDTALYSAGLTYKAVLEMFNEKQSDKWVERVYNEDAQYKYVAPYTDKGINYLSSAQGSRRSHRTWWLSKRFALCDSLFASGDFTAKAVEIKCVSGTPAGLQINMVSGTDMNYGYGLNRVPREVGVYVPFGESHTFTVDSELGIGTPVAIYAAPYLRSLDISSFAPYINTLNIANVSDATLGSRLKTLILGATGVENINVNSISGIDSATRLQTLDIKGFKGITSLDLSNQTELISLDATGSGLASVVFAKGAPVSTLKLPASMLALELEQLPKLDINGLHLENLKNISSMVIKGCPLLSNNIAFILSWLNTAGDNVSLDMDNVAWENVNYTDLVNIGSIRDVKLRGYAKLTEVSQEIIDILVNTFGDNVFDPQSDFYIDAPNSIFLSGPTEIIEGDSAKFSAVIFPATMTGTRLYSLEGSRTGVFVDQNTGIVTTTETGSADTSLKVRVVLIPDGDEPTISAIKDFVVKKRTYPSISEITLSGPNSISEEQLYKLEYSSAGFTGDISIEWQLSGDIANYVSVKSSDKTSCILEITTEIAEPVTGVLNVSVYKSTLGTLIGTKTLDIIAVNENVAETDSAVCSILYNAGLCANSSYITKTEARLVTDEQFNNLSFNNNTKIKSFNGFRYFTSVFNIKANFMASCTNLKSIELPINLTTIGNNAFYNCSALLNIVVPDNVTALRMSTFSNCSNLKNITIGKSVSEIEPNTFYSCSNLSSIYIKDIAAWCNIALVAESSPFVFAKNLFLNGELVTKVTIPDGVETVGNFAHYTNLEEVTLPSTVKIVKHSAFLGTNLHSINLPEGLVQIADLAFANTKLKSINIPSSVTTLGTTIFKGVPLETIVVASGNTTFDSRNNCNAVIKTSSNELVIGCSSTVIPIGVTSIGTSAFEGCIGITDINIPTTVKSIGERAFKGTELTSINLKDVTELKKEAFANTKFTSITLPPAISHVNEGLFEGCTELKSVTIERSEVSVGRYAFNGCVALTDVPWSNIGYINGSCFKGCSSLREAVLQSSSIADNSFENCTNLETVTITGSCTRIDDYVFNNCISLKNVNFEAPSLTMILRAFCNCTALEEIVIPDTVTSLRDYAFSNCTALRNVSIGNGVTYLYASTFENCSALEELVLPDSVKNISGWFTLPNLNKITLGSGLQNIGGLHRLYKLREIISLAEVAPTASSGVFYRGQNDYAGLEVPSGNKTLYVSTNAIGYEESYWLDELLNPEKCGFTISKTL